MHVKVHLNKLLLKSKFVISHGAYTYREQLVIEIAAKGMSGYGETVAIDYYGIKIKDLCNESDRMCIVIHDLSHEISISEFYQILLKELPNNPFLRCAFDEAFIDLKSRLAGVEVREFLGIELENEIPSSITIGLSDSSELIQQRLEEDWPVYKVKIDKSDRSSLFEKIRNSGSDFGIDANGALTLEEAQNVINSLSKYKALYGEQLIDKKKSSEAGRLNKVDTLIQLADESITSLEEAKAISPFYDGFVLKLTKCGGITPVLEIIKYAKANGKKLLAGCMTESSFGINHMLALLPLFDFADLDGAFLISNDEEIRSIDSKPKRILNTDGYFY